MSFDANPETAMAKTAHPTDFHVRIEPFRPAILAPTQMLRRWLGKVVDAIYQSRARQTQRDIELYISRRGSRMTDSLEREISERIQTGNWR